MSTVASGPLKQLLKVLVYNEPLEMLSCFACIFGDNYIMRVPVQQVSKHMGQHSSCPVRTPHGTLVGGTPRDHHEGGDAGIVRGES